MWYIITISYKGHDFLVNTVPILYLIHQV